VSRADLERLRASDALQQTLRFEYLEGYHVPFDHLTASTATEHELAHWSTRQGKVALIGASGSGKSSVMAAVLGHLNHKIPAWLVPVRIPVELASPEVIATTRDFTQHLIHQVIHWAAPEALSKNERDQLDRCTADLERRSGTKRRLGFSLGVPAYIIDAQLSGDITGSASEFERTIGAGDVVRQAQRMIELFRARQLEPFLVFDDTDGWLRLRGQEQEAAELVSAFFTRNVRMLAKELDCGFVVAVHEEYLANPGYQQTAGLLTHIEIPRLQDPVAAITQILQRRLDYHELDVQVSDIIEAPALDYLGFDYDDVPDLRRIFATASRAVAKALEDPDAERVSKNAIRAARAERSSRGGRL
jgi:energy-coupling factor transporter ATP-binding protein EcfA2